MADYRAIILSALAAVSVSVAALYSLGCQGSIAGVPIGPARCGLTVAGR